MKNRTYSLLRLWYFLIAMFSTARCFAAPGDEFWDGRFDALGIEGEVRAIAVLEDDVYVGGQFGTAGKVGAANIARWDGTNWWPVGGGVDGLGVATLAVDGRNLYVGGYFFQAVGASPDTVGVARWDGSSWQALANGISGAVRALKISGTDLYAGGHFTNTSGVLASNIARWDGMQWSALGSGISRIVRGAAGNIDLGDVWALSADRGYIYAGGTFEKAGGIAATNIAMWDGSMWTSLAGGTDGPVTVVQAMAATSRELYAAGYFRRVGQVVATNIARWDGSNWSELGGGLQQDNLTAVRCLVTSTESLFVGGQSFMRENSWNVLEWDGERWQPLGSGITPGSAVHALAIRGNRLYVGGSFDSAGGKPARNFSIWCLPRSPHRWKRRGSLLGCRPHQRCAGSQQFVGIGELEGS